jgi:CBS domain-containing protein
METETKRTPLQELRVVDVMHPGVIACPVETPLRTVARMMATYRVHAVAVMEHERDDGSHRALWGVISDVDLVAASRTRDIDVETAGALARRPVATVSTVESLERAAELMTEEGTTHLVVVERQADRPIGIVSTLDIARGLAGYRLEGSEKLTPWAAAL